MDKKKDLTKELLADCFRDLMLTVSFDKITIKMITDRAGLIRPTFYKHFQDKYEVLEWIFRTDVTDNVDLLLDNRMEIDAIVMFCRCIDRDRQFYRRACQMEPGPNSFEAILSRYILEAFLRAADNRNITVGRQPTPVTTELIAGFYTSGLANGIRDWLMQDKPVSAEEFAQTYQYLLTHSVRDLLISP